MKQSPIFKHAIETFEHGLEHYLEGSERSRKFAILHVDQAVELLLKERVIQLGKSIFKSDGTTLSMHEAFNALKDDLIPERPRLEELHDLRNGIQHKGLTPDPDSTDFYMQIAYAFIKRLLIEEFSTPIDTVINKQYRALVEGHSIHEIAEVTRIVSEARQSTSPPEKAVMIHTALVRLVGFLNESDQNRAGIADTLRMAAARRNADTKELRHYLQTIARSRYQALR